jgi:hypothetical protein
MDAATKEKNRRRKRDCGGKNSCSRRAVDADEENR